MEVNVGKPAKADGTRCIPYFFKLFSLVKGKLKDVGIEQRMNQRYVDDINIAAKATVPGLRYVEGNIIMDTTKVVEDKKRAPDKRTIELIRQVRISIHW